MAIPSQILLSMLLGLLSLAVIGAAGYLVYDWYDQSLVYDDRNLAGEGDGGRRVFRPDLGLNAATLALFGATALLFLALSGGRWLLKLILPRDPDPPRHQRDGDQRRLERPDGSELNVEVNGSPGGIPVVLTHGLSAEATLWYFVKRDLGAKYRIWVWDAVGTGRSSKAANRDYGIGRMAEDLASVVAMAAVESNGQPVSVVGHSMGGMINLELMKRGHDRAIRDLVEIHTTYTNPLRTTKGHRLHLVLQKPVIEPLLHLSIWLSPIIRLLNILSYLNGTTHLSTMRSGFVRSTFEMVDFVSRFALRSRPSVAGRMALSMLRWDASAALSGIGAPAMIVAADRDSTCVPGASEHMESVMPNAQLAVLSPAKHFGLLEHHRELTESLRRWIAASHVAPAAQEPGLQREGRERSEAGPGELGTY